MSNVKANTEKPKRDKYTWLASLSLKLTIKIYPGHLKKFQKHKIFKTFL